MSSTSTEDDRVVEDQGVFGDDHQPTTGIGIDGLGTIIPRGTGSQVADRILRTARARSSGGVRARPRNPKRSQGGVPNEAVGSGSNGGGGDGTGPNRDKNGGPNENGGNGGEPNGGAGGGDGGDDDSTYGSVGSVPRGQGPPRGFMRIGGMRTQGNPTLGAGIRLTMDIERDTYDNDIPESVEGRIFLALAYTAALIPETAIALANANNSWDDMNITVKYPKKFDVQVDGSGAVIRGIMHPNGEEPVWVPGKGDIKEYGTYCYANIADCPESEAREAFNMIYNGETDWVQIYIDLLNAWQTSGLTVGHVVSYTKWLKMEGISGEYLSKHFGKLTGGAPNVSDYPELRAMLREGKWTEYRSTFATIVGICVRFLDELPQKYSFIVSRNTRLLVKKAYNKEYKHSEAAFRAIPEIMLAYAYCWSEVTEMGIDNLWSGKRAYESLSYVQRESMMNILKAAKSEIVVWKTGVMTSVLAIDPSLKDI
jgi:hypothetical protein